VPYFKPGKELKELINREPEAPAPAAGGPPAASAPVTPAGADPDLAGV
jgi:hypothetical protein